MMKRPGRQRGFSLPELIIAAFIVGIGITAVAPLFVQASKKTAASADMADVGAYAVRQLENLRRAEFGVLAAGGSLTTDTTGYVDTSDPDYTIRWEIVDDSVNLKTIRVLAIANRQVDGPSKRIQLETRRSR